jgi:hypothetical protein
MTFQDALDCASDAGAELDKNPAHPVVKARFHATWLNVCRCIHRDHPDYYGDPDDIADPQTIVLADILLNEF